LAWNVDQVAFHTLYIRNGATHLNIETCFTSAKFVLFGSALRYRPYTNK